VLVAVHDGPAHFELWRVALDIAPSEVLLAGTRAGDLSWLTATSAFGGITIKLTAYLPTDAEADAEGGDGRVRCVHGYVLMQDSCPGCDAESERPHPADMVTVRAEWMKRPGRRCRRCSLTERASVHRTAEGGGDR